MSTTERESLTCPRCGHELASDKTIGRAGDVTITCPKCRAKDPLRDWRVSQVVKVNGTSATSEEHQVADFGTIYWSRWFYETFLGLLLLAVGLAVAVFVLAALYNMAEAESATDSLNAIAHNLAFFRWAFLAVLACKVFKAVLATLNAQPKADPASSHPIL